jgi:eukaryotic-like serine/threonine-protein kinase
VDFPPNGRQRLGFGLFEADLSSGELRKRGQRVHLQDKPFQLLSMLLERPGEVVTRDEVRTKLWPDGTYVDFDQGLDTALKKLRYALGDSAQNPTFIETIPRRGYRFMLPVTTDNGKPIPTSADAGRATRAHLWVFVAAVAAILVTGAVAVRFFRFYMRPSPRTSPEPKLRQLTANSSENRVTSGAISPDGKYLAYTDKKGMHIKLIESGESNSIPEPEALKGKNLDWDVSSLAWFPDSTRFVASAHPTILNANDPSDWTSQGSSIWMVSVLGGIPYLLRDNAVANAISHDGSFIFFGTHHGPFGDHELWRMRPNGEQAQKLIQSDEGSSIGFFLWSPDEQRVMYTNTDVSGDTALSRDVRGGPSTTLFTPTEMQNITDGSWLPDGRFIYSKREPTAIGDSCNYWSMRIDIRTGQPSEKPRRLTNWTGFCMGYTSATADAKRIAFLKSVSRATLYLAELVAGGSRILNPRHFTLDENLDHPQDWTADGKAILFTSNRAGRSEIYKQSVDADTPELIVGGAGEFRNVRASPDGKWAIAFRSAESGRPSDPEQLIRAPLDGGSPEFLFESRPGSKISCARPPSNLCVVAEPAEGRTLIVTAFDPVDGRGAELLRFDLAPHDQRWSVDVSNDGTQVAVLTGPAGPIQILSLRGQPPQAIQVQGSNAMQALNWASDGKGLYVANAAHGGSVLLYVDLKGDTRSLWENHGGNWAIGLPSPGRRHLVIQGSDVSSNIWMLENF